jgi:hypothetical protein
MPRTPADVRHAVSTVWLSAAPPGRWTEDAACRRYPGYAELFTDVVSFEEADLALTICAECPVRLACLRYGEQLRADGVWGGHLLRRGLARRRLDSRRPRTA